MVDRRLIVTVILAGIGADQTNINKNPPLYPNSEFEYIPIPEKTRKTNEKETLGSWALRYPQNGSGETAADYIGDPSNITQDPEENQTLSTISTEEEMRSWPVHHDPNFETLTYGEHRGAGGGMSYVQKLEELQEGDVVAFYTGLKTRARPGTPRYLIGYMLVDSVTSTEGMTSEEKLDVIEQHPQNAHSKRAVNGELFYDRYGSESKYVVFVDGKQPGGLFERDPVRITERQVATEREVEYITNNSFFGRFNSLSKTERRATSRKPAIALDISGEEFINEIGVPGNR